MIITVQLFATFRNGRFKEKQYTFNDNITIGQIIKELGINENEIGVALVNGRHASPDQMLSDNQNLSLFPLLTGG